MLGVEQWMKCRNGTSGLQSKKRILISKWNSNYFIAAAAGKRKQEQNEWKWNEVIAGVGYMVALIPFSFILLVILLVPAELNSFQQCLRQLSKQKEEWNERKRAQPINPLIHSLRFSPFHSENKANSFVALAAAFLFNFNLKLKMNAALRRLLASFH